MIKRKKQDNIKLSIELIPKTCQYSSARTMILTKEWNKIRLMSYENAGHQCEICGGNGLDQGFKHKLECHEIWSYNTTTHTQKLIGLISLCPICHLTKHIGRAFAMGRQAQVFKHLEIVNNWNHKQVVEHVAHAYMLNAERSKLKWTLDIKLLTLPPYDIKIDTTAKRIFKPKFKRRKYTKKK